MENKTLESLLNEYGSIAETLADSYGEITPEMEDSLSQIELNLPAKVDRCLAFLDGLKIEMASLKAMGDAVALRAERFYTKERQRIRLFDKCQEQIRFQMKTRNLKELAGIIETISFANKQGSVVIENAAAVPKRFVTQSVDEKIDKNAIKRAIIDGEDVPGARFDPNIARSINKERK